MNFRFSFAVLPLLVVACAAESADPVAGDEPELATSGLQSIEIGRGTGFVPPAPPGSCHPSGRYQVDFTLKQIAGDGCLDGRLVNVDRALDDAELARVKAAVAKVRTARRPAACPTDMPITSLTVKRASGTSELVDARASCGVSARPAVESTLANLLSVTEELARVPAGKVAGFDFDGFQVASVGGAEICPEIVDAVAARCEQIEGVSTATKGCKTLCSLPIAPRGKVAGFDFSGFTMAPEGGAEICPAVIREEEQACFAAGGHPAPAKGCKTLCSVPIAPRGKVAGYDFEGPKVLPEMPANMACPAVLRPEDAACERAGGTAKLADGCATLCSKPIVP